MTDNRSGGSFRRLAVVDPIGNDGGAMRFVRGLLLAIKRVRPEIRVHYFSNGASIARDGISEELATAGIDVSALDSTRARTWKSKPRGERLVYGVRRRVQRDVPKPAVILAAERQARWEREIAAIDADSDVVYFPWPFRVDVPPVSAPLVTTVHDLNFKYFFGIHTFTSDEVELMDAQIDAWLRRSSPVTSSQFMADEITRFYPAAPKPRIVRLAPFSAVTQPSARAREVVSELGIAGPYVLCPTHLNIHKNVGPLIAAHERLAGRFPGLKLVVTGLATDAATGRATSIGSIRDGSEPNVIGLGYVTNEQIDSLIDCASVVVNPSLYEAGNGSGLDAWSRGVPVAMSNIPSFTEHVEFFGVSAAIFDPRSPDDIAEQIGQVLGNPSAWSASAKRSATAIGGWTWDHVAAEYLEVFDAAFASRRDG